MSLIILGVFAYINLAIMCGYMAYCEDNSRLSGWIAFSYFLAAPFLILAAYRIPHWG